MRFTDNTELLDITGSGDEWSLFVELDDALIDAARDPRAVTVPKRLIPNLLTLKARLGSALAIVSGRTIEAVDRILAPASFDVAGMHGGELRAGNSRFNFGPSRAELLTRAAMKLKRLSQIHPGCLVLSEDAGIAVHWRLAPHLEQIVLDHVLELASELGADFRIQRHEGVVEILPAGAGKAKALAFLMNYPTFKGRRPIFVGGDLSDEPTLRLVRALGGFSVQIGSGAPGVEHVVRDGAIVRKWLMSWAQAGKAIYAGRLIDLREVQ